jgi:hypothetical protein
MRRRRTGSFMASAMLAIEAQQVIALRLAKLALGGPAARGEARRMVTEKADAAAKAAGLITAAALRGRPGTGANQAVRMLRRRVGANKKRLLG